ncbi:MAG: EAL domain-containing protein [bacterium]|nr:EAL domain-containing protein [bacterium]
MTLGTNRKSAFNVAAKAARRMQRGRVERRAAVWIWLLAVSGFVAAGLVGWWQWESTAIIDSPLAWWGLLIAFYASEWLVVATRYGGRPLVFTMSAVPLVVGLLAVAPVELIAVIALSTVVFAGSRRREPLVMLILLVGRRLLEAATAVVVFRLAGSVGETFGPTGWLVAIAAAGAAYMLGHGLVTLAMSIQGGTSSLGDSIEAYGFGAFMTIANAALGMLIAEALFSEPRAAAFAVVPALALYGGFRAYARSRQERLRLRSLYEATRDLHASPQLEHSLLAAAGHARNMFDSEFCEIVLQLGAERNVFRTIVGPEEHQEAMIPSEIDRWRLVWDQAESDGRPFVIDRSGSLASSAGDRRLPIVAAMVAPILVGESHIGIVVVANPLDDAALFSKADLQLLALLTEQVGVAVDNGQLEDSLAELTELKAELQHQALHDGLTGLANRSLFNESVFHALQMTRRTGGDVAVLLMDLDDFKEINDSLGHAAGDELLLAAAKLLREECNPEDTIARLGGDEFGVLLEDVAGVQEATEAAQRIISAFRSPIRVSGREVAAAVSIGIAFGRYGDTSNQVLHNADAAMYAAKSDGKGTFRVFESSMHAEVVAQLKMREDLEAAIARQELRLLYQPIVNLADGTLRGFEALVRWQHSLKGWQNPGLFIPFAEETGLIHDIGRWVLWEAARRCRDWVEILSPEPGEFKVTVNLSARQLDDESIVEEVGRVLSEMEFDPSFLVLEITETAMMNAAPELLDELRSLGVPLAIDDFGTGYSSLASLHKLSLDVLKIDQVFVQGITDEEENSSPFVGTMVGLGQALGLQTIVEGIETKEQLERLLELGCDTGQGFYFAKPLALGQAGQLVERQSAGQVVFDLEAMASGYRDRRLRSVH